MASLLALGTVVHAVVYFVPVDHKYPPPLISPVCWWCVLLPYVLLQPPSKYTKEEFHNNVLPRAADNQPPRILNELRQLSCRLVASGIAKGLLKQDDLPEIRKTLVNRFQVGVDVAVGVVAGGGGGGGGGAGGRVGARFCL